MKESLNLHELKIRWLLGIEVIKIILMVIMVFLSEFIAFRISSNSQTMNMDIEFWTSSIIMIVLASILFPSIGIIKESVKDLKKSISIKEVLGIVFTQMALSLSLAFLIVGLIGFFNLDLANKIYNEQIFEVFTTGDRILMMLMGIIVAPIAEELVFRGVLFRRIGKRFGVWAGIIISSILFGIGHINAAVLGAIIFGITNCILYMKYKNILVPIFVHFINNFIAFIPDMINPTTTNEVMKITTDDIKSYLMMGLIILSIALIFFIRFIKKNKKYITKEITI